MDRPSPFPLPPARLIALWFSAVTFILLNLGYGAYRTDHLSQVPMLMAKLDPSLFQRDWYFGGEAAYTARGIFLAFEVHLHRLTGSIAITLFVQYLAYLMAFVAACWAIVRGLGGRVGLIAVWLLFLVSAGEYGDLGTTFLIERSTLPRMYGYLGVLFAIGLLLRGRPLVAGLAMAALSLFQAAPALLALPVLVAWQFTLHQPAKAARRALLFAAPVGAICGVQALLLADLVAGPELYTAAERIHLLGWLRHPHHMIPLMMSAGDYWETLAMLLFFWARVRAIRPDDPERPLVPLVALLLAWFVLASFLIHVVPVAAVVAIQPFRLNNIFRATVFLIATFHLLQLLKAGEAVPWFRGVAFLVGVIGGEKWEGLLALVFLLEALYAAIPALARGTRPVWVGAAGFAAAPLLSNDYSDHRAAVAGVIVLAAITQWKSPWTFWIGRRLAALGRRAAWPYLGAGLGVLLVAVLLAAPFPQERVQEAHRWNWLTSEHADLADRYQVWPYATGELERAAAWAKDNTPPDALFLTPPGEANQSWHIWSERSAVFLFKTFPFKQREWATWLELYAQVRGIPEPREHPAMCEWFLHDYQGALLDRDYYRLPAWYVAWLAEHTGADYIVTRHRTLDRHPALEKVAGPIFGLSTMSDPPGERRDKDGLVIYRVLSRGTEVP
ncbi:MAG: DUF6798 domain-containing protein [Sumerlaeia bacterium]